MKRIFAQVTRRRRDRVAEAPADVRRAEAVRAEAMAAVAAAEAFLSAVDV